MTIYMTYPKVLEGIQDGTIAKATRMEGSYIRELRAEKVKGVWFPTQYVDGEPSGSQLNVWDFTAQWHVIYRPDEEVMESGFYMATDEFSRVWNDPEPFRNKKLSEVIHISSLVNVLRVYKVIDGRIECVWEHDSMSRRTIPNTGGETNE